VRLGLLSMSALSVAVFMGALALVQGSGAGGALDTWPCVPKLLRWHQMISMDGWSIMPQSTTIAGKERTAHQSHSLLFDLLTSQSYLQQSLSPAVAFSTRAGSRFAFADPLPGAEIESGIT
jgi:hypothetical protein